MKAGVFKTACAMLLLTIQSFEASADDDPLVPYKVSQITETLTYDSEGRVSGKEVVSDSKVDIKVRIVERHVANGHGGLRLVGRITTVHDTHGRIVTTTEGLSNPASDALVVADITTVTRDAAGGSVTTTEGRDSVGNLTINRRVTVVRENSQTITTVETLDKNSNLIVTSQTTAQRNLPQPQY